MWRFIEDFSWRWRQISGRECTWKLTSNVLRNLFFLWNVTNNKEESLPVSTRRRFNVYSTSSDVESTWIRRWCACLATIYDNPLDTEYFLRRWGQISGTDDFKDDSWMRTISWYLYDVIYYVIYVQGASVWMCENLQIYMKTRFIIIIR